MFNIRKLMISYGLIFLSIVILSVISLFLLNYTINKQERDARLINISGKQRMLGQRIEKDIHFIHLSKSPQQIEDLKKDLLKSVKHWEASARLLQIGDPQEHIPSLNEDPKYRKLFKGLEPHFNKVRQQAYKTISTEEYRFSYVAFELSNLQTESEKCLEYNDKITKELEKDAEARFKKVKSMAFYCWSAIILVLVLETYFIFRPMYRRMKQSQLDLEENQKETKRIHLELWEKNRELVVNEEEIRTQAERLNHLNLILDDQVKHRTREITLKNQALKGLIEELEIKNKELDQLIYRITHDLRAPVASILGLLRICDREQEIDSLKQYNSLAIS
ncbi:MAG: type IV pili methyl-accepting chemotaxis transducer N-terminal domain-containing protein, partial [Bacteroidota bacterium]